MNIQIKNEIKNVKDNKDGNDKKIKKYEVDFIIKNNKHLIPIEVKSSTYKNHKSIDNFYKIFNLKIKVLSYIQKIIKDRVI